MAGDFSVHRNNSSLVVGIRGSSIVVGVSRDGVQSCISLSTQEAYDLTKWLNTSTEEIASVSPHALLRAGAEALGKMERGEFECRTSKQFWDLGFDVGSEKSEYAEGDGWCAILCRESGEIEVYVPGRESDIAAIKICIATGQVVRI